MMCLLCTWNCAKHLNVRQVLTFSRTSDIFLALDILEISQEEGLRARNGSQSLLLVIYWRFLKLSWELNAPQNFLGGGSSFLDRGHERSVCLVCSKHSSIAQIRHN